MANPNPLPGTPTADDPVPQLIDPTVLEKEWQAIARRRQAVDPPLPTPDDKARSLVGLALSGGGVRSASFNLGLLQAFLRYGLLRHVDYLSTVSGGGYIGSYLSALLRGSEKPLSKDNPTVNKELRPGHNGLQPKRVTEFVRNGQYLFHPLPFLNRYCLGFLLNNLAIFSGIVFLCALAALAWRALDMYPVAEGLFSVSRDWWPVGFREWNRPFLPAMFLFLIWFLLWGHTLLVSWRRGERPTNRTARYFLLAGGIALLAGTAVWLSTPTINIIQPEENATEHQPVTASSFSLPPQAIGTGLAGLVVTALLPFLKPKQLLNSGIHPTRWYHPWVFGFASTALFLGVPFFLIFLFARHDLSDSNTHLRKELSDSDIYFYKWRQFWNRIGHEGTTPPAKPVAAPGRYPSLGQLLWVELENRGIDRDAIQGDGLAARLERAAVPLDPKDRARKQQVIDQFNAVIRASDFYKRVEEFHRKDPDWLKAHADHHPEGPRIRALIERARSGRLVNLERQELNRLLLEASYPEEIWPRIAVRRHTLVEPKKDDKARSDEAHSYIAYRLVNKDQIVRLWWAGGSFLVFLATALFVYPNLTSLHSFYRDYLSKAFLAPNAGGPEQLSLSNLDTTPQGGPYHLLAATSNPIPGLRRLLCGTDKGAPERDTEAQAFLLSPNYCGGEAPLGYCRTADYMGGRLELGDAMAISGAALSPVRVHNPLALLLMTVFNFRLGQWFAHPRVPSERSQPSILSLLRDLWRDRKDRRYCFVTDGGHYENLGLEPLLRRECRLILVADATHDPDYTCDDFLRIYRRARGSMGIRLCPLDETDDHTLPLDLLRPTSWHSRRHPSPEEPAGGPLSPRHYFLARIEYPSGRTGLLVVLKPSLTGDEENDLSGYHHRHRTFPQDTTADQFYDEDHFESYRQLGYHIGERLCRDLLSQAVNPGGAALWSKDVLFWQEIDRWEQRWQQEQAPPVLGVDFVRHGATDLLHGRLDSISLSPEDVYQLRRLVGAARFFDLRPSNGVGAAGPAQDHYRITVTTPERRHTITVDDQSASDELRSLLKWLTTKATANGS